jgi:hypothetical protein
MADGLDELEEQASSRRRGRNPGGSRNKRNRAEEERQRREQELAVREQERKRREEERQRREEEERLRREEEERQERETEVRYQSDPEPELSDRSTAGAATRRRPPSIPFYYDPDNEEFLWEITEVAAARRTKVPASAVLRLAMRRLQDQMPVERIVQELGGPSPVTGKRGRPRR